MWALVPLRQDVCLHCQFRQTLQAFRKDRLPKSATARPIAYSARKLGSQPVRRQQGKDTDPSQEQGERWPSDHGFDRHFQEEYGEVAPPASSPVSERYRNQVTAGFQRSRKRGHGGYYMKQVVPVNLNKIALEMNSLGQPASILRLDVSKNVRKPAFIETQEPQEELEAEREGGVPSHILSASQDILQDVLGGSAKLKPEEIVESIDQLKDEWLSQIDPKKAPSQQQCNSVSQFLSSGFTIEQLEHYLEATARDQTEEFDDLQGVLVSDICTRSKWFAGKSSIEKTSELRLFAKNAAIDTWRLCLPDSKQQSKKSPLPKLSKKESIIEGILRRSWMLRSGKELSKVGELDVSITPEHWRLLESRYDLFRQLEDQLQVEIEQNKEKGIFRIRGKHYECGKAFIALYAPLQAIAVKRLELQSGIRPELNVSNATGAGRLWQDELLQDIGAFTKSLITRVQNERGELSGFDVTFLAPQRSDGSGPETMILNSVRHIVEMITSDRSSQNDMRLIAHLKTVQCEQVPVLGDATLPMHHRSAHWYRFRDINHWQQGSDYSYDVRQIFKLAVRAATSMLTTWKPRHIETDQDPYSPEWTTDSRSVIAVKTGYLAFNDPDKEEPLLDNDTNNDEPVNESKTLTRFEAFKNFVERRPRMFISSLPGGVTSFERINEIDPESEQRIVVRLKPAGFPLDSLHDKEPNLSIFPDLVLEMRPSPKVKDAVDLLSASLVVSHPTKELMMPFDESDLQLSSKTIVGGTEGALDPTIIAYVDAMLTRKDRIDERSIPPGLELNIPQRALREYHVDQDKQQDLSKYQRIVENSQAHTPKPEATSSGDLLRPTTADLLGPSTSTKKEANMYGSEADVGWLEDMETDETPTDSEERFDRFIESESPSIQYRSNEYHSPIRAYYQFSGLEYHYRLRGSFKSYPLTYTIVDAGGIGGRYEELTLDARVSEEGRLLDKMMFPSEEVQEGDEEDSGKGIAADALEKAASEQSRTAKKRKRYQLQHLERWYLNRIQQTPGISWFLPWFDTALEMVRRLR